MDNQLLKSPERAGGAAYGAISHGNHILFEDGQFRDTILSRMHRMSARELYPRPRS